MLFWGIGGSGSCFRHGREPPFQTAVCPGVISGVTGTTTAGDRYPCLFARPRSNRTGGGSRITHRLRRLQMSEVCGITCRLRRPEVQTNNDGGDTSGNERWIGSSRQPHKCRAPADDAEQDQQPYCDRDIADGHGRDRQTLSRQTKRTVPFAPPHVRFAL